MAHHEFKVVEVPGPGYISGTYDSPLDNPTRIWNLYAEQGWEIIHIYPCDKRHLAILRREKQNNV